MEFINGFDSWQETHFEMVAAIIGFRIDEHPFFMDIYDNGGTGSFYDLAKDWTNEFEMLHKDREWDGEFFEEIESFISSKIID